LGDAERLRRSLAAIDAANAGDPNRLWVRGESRPKELAHAELVSEWVERLTPEPAEALRLAARAHHLRRWTIPRSEYPAGRRGYLRWRRALHVLHAREVAAILGAEGYDDATIRRVQDLVQKKDLGRDAEVQILEDALCLVFLETQLRDLAAQLDDERLLDVLRKTLRKMSPEAVRRAEALALDADARALLQRAIAG
jgi:hypothetical protein